MQFLDLAVFPDDRLHLKRELGSDTSWVERSVFSLSNQLAPVVDFVRHSVVAAESGERRHHTVLPKEGQTYKMGRKAKEIAKFLPQGIWGRSLGGAGHLALLVEWKGCAAVWTPKRVEVRHQSICPEKGVLVLVS